MTEPATPPESPMSVTYHEIAAALGTLLGFGRTASAWTADQLAQIHDYIDAGYQEFLGAHPWSFLVATATITTEAGESFYDLPADFSAPRGPLVYDSSLGLKPLELVGLGVFLDLQARGDVGGYPCKAAIRPKASDGAESHKREIGLWPAPSGEFSLYLPYRIAAPLKLRTTAPYPVGGMDHGETLKAICLANAEEMGMEAANGPRRARADRLLARSIQMDSEFEPDIIGRVASDGDLFSYDGRPATLIYNGVEI